MASVNEHALTVANLIAIESLEITLLAGADGASRRLLWAHVCELPDPVTWLSADELLMTVGMAIPREPAEQADLIQNMAEAGLSGLLAGDQETLPTLSQAMIETADSLDFPLMLIDGDLPFAAVSRHVASLSAETNSEQVMLLAKLYGITSARTHNRTSVPVRIAELLGIGIRVKESETGLVLVEAVPEESAVIKAGERREFSESDEAGRRQRVRSYRINTVQPTTLDIVEPVDQQVSSMVLVHLRNIIEVEVDRMLNRIAERTRERSRILRQSLTEELHPELTALLPLTERGVRVVAFSPDRAELFSRTAVVESHPVVVTSLRGHGIALVPEEQLDWARGALARFGTYSGVSTVHGSLSEIREAVLQAEDALETSNQHSMVWTEYAGIELVLLSRSVAEAEYIVDGVLGPIAGDDRRSITLRETLFAYFDNNRRWSETAAVLDVHRQTLAYRLRQIESLLDRTVTETHDIALLWIAMRAWTVLHTEK